MSKKLVLLLLPLLVFISGYTAGYDNHRMAGKDGGLCFYHLADDTEASGHFNVTGHNKDHIQKNIRVKAWDDAAGINIFPATFFRSAPQYSSDLVYFGYRACLRSSHFFSYSLRGPPTAA